MINIALCDDNELQRELMYDYLCEYKNVHPDIDFSVFENGSELLNCAKNEYGFDIYILDVVMPDINGLEIAATLRMMGDSGNIVFTTSSTEYAIASYDVQALYYMIKPVEPKKLFRILDNALYRQFIIDKSLEIKTPNGKLRLKSGDIMMVEIINRGMRYYLKDGRICDGCKLRKPFKEEVQQIIDVNSNFVFCGAGKLVNLEYVDAIDCGSFLLSDGTSRSFPKSVYSELKAAWSGYNKFD